MTPNVKTVHAQFPRKLLFLLNVPEVLGGALRRAVFALREDARESEVGDGKEDGMKPSKRWIPPTDEVMAKIFPGWGKRTAQVFQDMARETENEVKAQVVTAYVSSQVSE
jgi:hypothetical protein